MGIYLLFLWKLYFRYLGKMNSNKNKTLWIKAQMCDTQSLKVLQGLMPNSIERKSTLKYGMIFDLLRILVKVEVNTPLAQFYYPSLRCTLFRDFLLALVLEEFWMYLDLPKDKNGPYIGMGQKVKPKDLAMTLGILVGDLVLHYKWDRDVQGLKSSYLKGVAQRLAGIERWGGLCG